MSAAMTFLLWTKGPLFALALTIFALGLMVRLSEIFVLGRARNHAAPRAAEWPAGLRTMLTRSLADPGTFRRAPFNVLVGWLWHIGFLVTLLLFVPHIDLIRSLTGLSWPGLPNPLISLTTAVTLVALLATLVHRLNHPVKRRISTVEDYLVWGVVFAVVLTGFLAYYRWIHPYPLILGLHILAAEILLVLLPFTKLTHIFTAFVARWYNGAAFGRKGVPS